MNTVLALAFIFIPAVWAQAPSVTHPLTSVSVSFSIEDISRAEKILEEAAAAYAQTNEYSALLIKQEKIRNRLRKEEVLQLKFQKPFNVYLNFVDSPDKGMEIIYKKEENPHKMKAHLGGFLNAVVPSIELDIKDKLAIRNNRHLISETGIGEFLKKYQHDFQIAKKKGEVGILIQTNQKIFNRMAVRVEAILPKEEAKGYYCYRSVVYFDAENKLPIYMEFYDFNNELFEKYGYKDLNLKPELKPIDFDTENEAYHF